MIRNKLAILGLLKEHPMHGYQIDQEIRKRQMHVWADIAIASIYNTLIAFEKSGSIMVKKEKIGNMPERKVYHITAKGVKELQELIKEGLAKVAKSNNIVFHLSIAFMSNIAPHEAITSLKERKNKLEQVILMVKEIQKTHKLFLSFNWMYVIDYSLKHVLIDMEGTKYLIKKTASIKNWQKIIEQTKEKCKKHMGEIQCAHLH
ncbi:MAG: PadR family transcriptional regulator [Endomicrobiales bacterium]|nr:PadR family transcriptional regulator [Endomicrobiales bacterium]